ncbi:MULTISPECIES: manganese-dependent inorganic pyrophosphatase [Oceanobacillus]|uniref:Probable manganese-dependent inorganic pyrophosphatase n=1 Tax=Oceanobacillus kimchii TaxID=746691 RepID=A0ABQ5TH85_9BACI|nr:MULTISPECIES: manganese-dependent inorganic pyrophosphatase [Oceanobacillus]MBT2599273.1 manganese-dependent inorganic pyrophosphatase [Oceanobacillus sp. ISL-74]MBT2652191.1 manganese-dependent inorganic pyrophosphatase [Oceanobacillus sp. ISL-73]MCT1578527.1 manganese-dependent inorganic pyrophosphatase [Oceanobacillus kimchii]MCT2136424.1 manganese-dependent inorganic pyrophosphatase [Oceanobacillus kimchii]OEH54170.1 inorganic pyrophosphatase [Oceanobacillus sp. E9]
MVKTLIFGHKNPDTDTICSSIAYADLKTKRGYDVTHVRLGEVNKETQFALDQFNIKAPELIERVEDGAEVILVDHNEFQQSVDNIENATIREVIDHHRISNFETKEPLYFRAEPVGCTATILNKMYKENDISVDKNIAGILLSAIISDSLLLKSPTCTDEDVQAAHELAEIAGVDLESYGLDMLKAGADLSDKTVKDLITMDAKEFAMGNAKVEIAQVNAVDTSEIYKLHDELVEVITSRTNDNDLDLFLFVVTDILNNDSEVLAIGNGKDKVNSAFNVALDSNNRALLKGVVSRKKQIVTVLTEQFK